MMKKLVWVFKSGVNSKYVDCVILLTTTIYVIVLTVMCVYFTIYDPVRASEERLQTQYNELQRWIHSTD